MANLDAPRGFNPLRNPAGTTPAIAYYEAAAGEDIFIGTLCYLDNTAGEIYAFVDGVTTGVGQIVGVATNYVASGDTTRTVGVTSDPMQEYEIQCEANTITDIGDIVGQYFPPVNSETGSAATGRSAAELDDAEGNTSVATDEVLLGLRLSGAINDDASLANNNVVVMVAPEAHLYHSGTSPA
jgi:hypothetical protein